MTKTAAERRTYADLDAYYEASPTASRSGESDYGVWNWDDLGIFSTRGETGRIRVSHVHLTGEFYAFAHFARGDKLAVLGRVEAPPAWVVDAWLDPKQDLTSATRKAIDRHVHDVYAVFDGWAEGEDLGRPLSWFVNRLRLVNEVCLTCDSGLPWFYKESCAKCVCEAAAAEARRRIREVGA